MRILVPSSGPDDWRRLLADPGRQWRDGYSAKELAHRWEAAGALPPEVSSLFRSCGSPVIRNAEPLLAIPEYKVPLPGGRKPSQNDVFMLASGAGRLIAITVEGKARESFGKTLDKWLQNPSAGKLKRLAFLKSVLGLSGNIDRQIRYQLLHRTASALIEGARFCASFAVMIVHGFGDQRASIQDYAAFLGLFGTTYEPGQIVRLGSPGGIELYSGWAQKAGSHMPTSNEILAPHREQTPPWLERLDTTLPTPDTVADFLASRVIYYPGSGTDGHALKLFGGSHSAHCFVHCDYGVHIDEVREQLQPDHRWHPEGYRPLFLAVLGVEQVRQLFGIDRNDRWHPGGGGNWPGPQLTGGIWAVLGTGRK